MDLKLIKTFCWGHNNIDGGDLLLESCFQTENKYRVDFTMGKTKSSSLHGEPHYNR